MKIKYLALTCCMLAALGLQSCVKEMNLLQEEPITYSELTLQLDDETLDMETTIAKATTGQAATRARIDSLITDKSVLGVAVQMKRGNESWRHYAYGIFTLDGIMKNENALKLRVIDGYLYRVSCTMVGNALERLQDSRQKLGAPFYLTQRGDVRQKGEVTNRFIASEENSGEVKGLYDIDKSFVEPRNPAAVGLNSAEEWKEITRPFFARYHWMSGDISVNSSMSVPVTLHRRFFGVKFWQAGLENGRLRIKMTGSPNIYLPASANPALEATSTDSLLVSMERLNTEIRTGSDASFYPSESVEITVTWQKDGTEASEVEILKATRAFKRNHFYNIRLSNIDHVGTPLGITLSIDEENLRPELPLDLPWQGSEK